MIGPVPWRKSWEYGDISAKRETRAWLANRAEVPRRLRAITSNWTNSVQLTLTGSIGRPCQPGHTAILSGRHTYDVKKSDSRAKNRSETLLFDSFPSVVRSKYISRRQALSHCLLIVRFVLRANTCMLHWKFVQLCFSLKNKIGNM